MSEDRTVLFRLAPDQRPSPLASVYLSAATPALVYWAYRHRTRHSPEGGGERI
jgi:hypothetical protein